MNVIDFNEIQSISVLKDASATAVFGVKGGNGVILITTKRGQQGKPRFNIEAEMSFETPSKMIGAADTWQGIIARNHAIERTRRFITDRKSVVKGKRVSVRVDLGGRRRNKKKKK